MIEECTICKRIAFSMTWLICYILGCLAIVMLLEYLDRVESR